MSSQVLPLQLAQGSHFENCCSRLYPATGTYANFCGKEQLSWVRVLSLPLTVQLWPTYSTSLFLSSQLQSGDSDNIGDYEKIHVNH